MIGCNLITLIIGSDVYNFQQDWERLEKFAKLHRLGAKAWSTAKTDDERNEINGYCQQGIDALGIVRVNKIES